MDDLNSDLGDSIGVRGTYKPNQRSLKLLDLVNHLNLCTVNLTAKCTFSLETYVSLWTVSFHDRLFILAKLLV